jgi:hypothetical protein
MRFGRVTRRRRSSSMAFGKKRRKYMLPRRSSDSMEFGRRRRRKAGTRRLPRRSSESMEFGRRRRRARTRRPAKHRVKGSAPCGGLRRKVCKASGCSYVSTRRLAGCKRKGGRKPAMPAMRVMGNELALRFGRRRRSRRSV